MEMNVAGSLGFDLYEVTPNEWILDTKNADESGKIEGTRIVQCTCNECIYGKACI